MPYQDDHYTHDNNVINKNNHIDATNMQVTIEDKVVSLTLHDTKLLNRIQNLWNHALGDCLRAI